MAVWDSVATWFSKNFLITLLVAALLIGCAVQFLIEPCKRTTEYRFPDWVFVMTPPARAQN